MTSLKLNCGEIGKENKTEIKMLNAGEPFPGFQKNYFLRAVNCRHGDGNYKSQYISSKEEP
jgi:hypothetical protein